MSIIQRQSIVQHANIDISQSKWYILCYMHMCRQLPVASPRALRQTVTAFAIPSKTSVQFASPIIFYRPQIKPKKKKIWWTKKNTNKIQMRSILFRVCVLCRAAWPKRIPTRFVRHFDLCTAHISESKKKCIWTLHMFCCRWRSQPKNWLVLYPIQSAI